MSIVSYFKNVASGNYLKRNKLLGGVKSVLEQKVENQIKNKALQNFFLTTLLTNDIILTDLFFELAVLKNKKIDTSVNDFKDYKDRLTEDRIIEAHKILSQFIIITFFMRKDNVELLSEITNIEKDKLFSTMFFKYLDKVFDFDSEDLAASLNLYKVYLEGDKSDFFVNLYTSFLKEVLNIEFQNPDSLAFFSYVISHHYSNIFLGLLRSKLDLE